MAIVAHTTYTDHGDCARVNHYLCDGHGRAKAERTNRYISDDHGGDHQCMGHRCPSDSDLATTYMARIRWNYERQHNISPGRKKGVVSHVQFYVSPSVCDHVPAAERMEMTRELIERTVLRDFPSIYIPHDNTETGHCHISVCPFAEDGSHKLCVNNRLLYDLRREMDRICVEHGYSIIENANLWGDKEYKVWFHEVKKEGKISIHPPREQNKALNKKTGKRARDYDHSKRAKIRKEEELEAYYKELTAKYTPEQDGLFYTSPYLYHPTNPGEPLRIRNIRADGSKCSELDLRVAALGTWAYRCSKELDKKAIPGTEKLSNRMRGIASKAYHVRILLEELDIQTHEELILHIKECGQDIGALKRYIQQQDETGHAMAKARKERSTALLEERSKEYRKLKEAEVVLHPASSREEWEGYLNTLFSHNINQCVWSISPEELEVRIYELGNLLGISDDTLRKYVTAAEDYARFLRMDAFCRKEHRDYIRHLASAREKKQMGFQHYWDIYWASLRK